MNIYYGVQTEFYNNGSVKVSPILTRESKEMPKNQCKETPIADCYIDWFASREQAEAFLSEARAA